MKTARKAIASTLCAIFVLGVVGVSAAWENAGYDISPAAVSSGEFAKIYNEFENSEWTGNTKKVVLGATDIAWKAEGFEAAYPHAGYNRLYLEGNAQPITQYNGVFPQWETRFQDVFWEVKAPYSIYQRQQTNIPGRGWSWDWGNPALGIADSKVFFDSGKDAAVDVSYKKLGFANLTLDGIEVDAIKDGAKIDAMYKASGYNKQSLNDLLKGTYANAEQALSAKDAKGNFVLTDDTIAKMIPLVESKILTGPSIEGDSGKKDLAELYVKYFGQGWSWDPIVRFNYSYIKDCQTIFVTPSISWTAQMYEWQDNPTSAIKAYKYYQYLIVEGIAMDGSIVVKDGVEYKKPYIYRYTGGTATPSLNEIPNKSPTTGTIHPKSAGGA